MKLRLRWNLKSESGNSAPGVINGRLGCSVEGLWLLNTKKAVLIMSEQSKEAKVRTMNLDLNSDSGYVNPYEESSKQDAEDFRQARWIESKDVLGMGSGDTELSTDLIKEALRIPPSFVLFDPAVRATEHYRQGVPLTKEDWVVLDALREAFLGVKGEHKSLDNANLSALAAEYPDFPKEVVRSIVLMAYHSKQASKAQKVVESYLEGLGEWYSDDDRVRDVMIDYLENTGFNASEALSKLSSVLSEIGEEQE